MVRSAHAFRLSACRLTSPKAFFGVGCTLCSYALAFRALIEVGLSFLRYQEAWSLCSFSLLLDRLLVIYNSELRSEPNKALNKIFKFVGLPEFDYSEISSEDANEAFNKKYPNFEEMTGYVFYNLELIRSHAAGRGLSIA